MTGHRSAVWEIMHRVSKSTAPKQKVKVKVNVDLYSVLSWTHLYGAQVYGTRSQGISQFTCTPRAHPLTEWTIPAFAFPAEAGTHLPTPEGWKVELALVTYQPASMVEGFRYTSGSLKGQRYLQTIAERPN